MNNASHRTSNLYQRRLDKENGITEDEVNARMRWDLPILSTNPKCSVSLDLPMTHCIPTAICAQVCYASQGRQYYRRCVVKSLAIDRLIELEPDHVARKMVDEAAGRPIRIAGSGEALPEYWKLLDFVDQFGGYSWGFTRRVDTHQAIPSFMFSFDATSPAEAMQHARDEVPLNRRAYLRRPEDPPSDLEVAVTLPIHGRLTPYVKATPQHETDCPAVRGQVAGCWGCKRCY